MKTTFYLNEIGKVRDYNDETSIRKATNFEFEFIKCPAVDISDLRNSMVAYRNSLNNHETPEIIYQKRADVEREIQMVYKHIYEVMK